MKVSGYVFSGFMTHLLVQVGYNKALKINHGNPLTYFNKLFTIFRFDVILMKTQIRMEFRSD